MSSKIKVDTIENVAGSGNVSLGSGHNLVVPGNITGQGTTTLTDDLTVDTNTLFVDASADKVGINNTTPGSYLSSDLVVGDTTGDNAITVVSGNANASGIFFQDTTGVSIVSGVRYQHDINKMGLWTNGNERLSINTDGNVLKPSQPFFVAKPTASGDGQTRDPYKFENVIHNVGNHFVTSGTGAHERFVAPVTGRYMFTAMPGYLQGGNNFAVRFLINGSIFAEPVRFIQGSAASHCAFTCSIIVQLSANDYVTLSPAGFTYHINTTYTFFSGILLS